MADNPDMYFERFRKAHHIDETEEDKPQTFYKRLRRIITRGQHTYHNYYIQQASFNWDAGNLARYHFWSALEVITRGRNRGQQDLQTSS